jgi:hypothetical protein
MFSTGSSPEVVEIGATGADGVESAAAGGSASLERVGGL